MKKLLIFRIIKFKKKRIQKNMEMSINNKIWIILQKLIII